MHALSQSPATSAQILVVDDEGPNRYSISKNLERVGYSVTEAASGPEALEHLTTNEFDVVLTDIKMPDMDGVELLRHIKAESPEAVVILMTGYASLPSAVEALRLGAHDYFIKPGSMNDLRAAIARGVERSRNMRRRRMLFESIRSDVFELDQIESASTGPAIPGMPAVGTPTSAVATSAGYANRWDVPEVGSVMQLGPLTVYPGRYQISADDQQIDLTPTEFDLLLYLGAHGGRVVPCHELVREVRSYSVDEAEAREVIRPHISNLRRKLKQAGQNPDLIVNVRGVGYRLNDRVR
ncbi:MAG: hypothetical protein B6D42_17000 [Anaerolineae bacterium UTCFX5]|nr:MAG: hypothetical protein B6D42_17000 [Anaerolineae bacterium UTCFX5]